MIDGLGAALSALSAQTQRMDALANDTANLNTTGYRSDRIGFTDLAPAARGVATRVDFADTAVGMIEARSSYAAAISALHVQDEMWSALLELRDGSDRR
jgi:flagellar basal body rod protein FlgG